MRAPFLRMWAGEFDRRHGLLGVWKIANGCYQQIEASFTLWMEPLAASTHQAEDLIVSNVSGSSLCAPPGGLDTFDVSQRVLDFLLVNH